MTISALFSLDWPRLFILVKSNNRIDFNITRHVEDCCIQKVSGGRFYLDHLLYVLIKLFVNSELLVIFRCKLNSNRQLFSFEKG